MFQITSYLQYRNTPDGKPRVLRRGVDYFHQGGDRLWQFKGYSNTPDYEGHLLSEVAKLSDCRQLLTVDLDYYSPEGIKPMQYTEGDVLAGTPSNRRPFMPFKGIVYFNEYFELAIDNQVHNKIFPLVTFGDDIPEVQKLGSFFDDPAKYSKLLWNYSEEEGWQKLFELLKIKI